MTYQARQADLTGGAANFFLVTPLALALGAPADGAATGAGCSAMTGSAGSFVSMRRRWLSRTGLGRTEIIRSAYARGVKEKQTPAGRTRGRKGKGTDGRDMMGCGGIDYDGTRWDMAGRDRLGQGQDGS